MTRVVNDKIKFIFINRVHESCKVYSESEFSDMDSDTASYDNCEAFMDDVVLKFVAGITFSVPLPCRARLVRT